MVNDFLVGYVVDYPCLIVICGRSNWFRFFEVAEFKSGVVGLASVASPITD
jgi:hypothetical protein